VSIYFSQHLTLKAKLRQRNVFCVLHLLLKRFAMQFTYMIQRILTEVSSTLMLLVKNTNTHIVKTVVYYFDCCDSDQLGMSLKRSASVCGSKIHMYGQHLYLLSFCKAFEDKMNVSTCHIYVIFSLQCLCLLFNGFSFLISYHHF